MTNTQIKNVLTQNIINNMVSLLGQEGRVFQSEAQFQFDLAWKIQEYCKDYGCKVFLEVPSPYSTEITQESIKTSSKRRFYDIVVLDKHGNFVVIELKYKILGGTKPFLYKNNQIQLLPQGAGDLGRCYYLHDIERLEALAKDCSTITLMNKQFKNFIRGFAIIITNDKNYWEEHGYNCTSVHKDFCTAHGDKITAGIKKWREGSKETKSKKVVNIQGEYECNWMPYYSEEEYKQCRRIDNPAFMYLTITVEGIK